MGEVMAKGNIDITKNIRLIEQLKSELLLNTATLFSLLTDENPEIIKGRTSDAISNIIITAYLLAKRLGIEYHQIDQFVNNTLKKEINTNHEIEKNYKEISQLLKHLSNQETSQACLQKDV